MLEVGPHEPIGRWWERTWGAGCRISIRSSPAPPCSCSFGCASAQNLFQRQEKNWRSEFFCRAPFRHLCGRPSYLAHLGILNIKTNSMYWHVFKGHLFTKTKLYRKPECFSTISFNSFKAGVHGLASIVTPLYLYLSPSSPYAACCLGMLWTFPNTFTWARLPVRYSTSFSS